MPGNEHRRAGHPDSGADNECRETSKGAQAILTLVLITCQKTSGVTSQSVSKADTVSKNKLRSTGHSDSGADKKCRKTSEGT